MSKPSDLIEMLETLNHDITQFSYRCEDMQGEVNKQQIMFTDMFSSYKQKSYRLQDELEHHISTFKALREVQSNLKGKCQQTQSYTDGVIEAAYASMKDMGALLDQWRKNEEQAIDDVNAARKRYQATQEDYNFARQRHENAQNEQNSLYNQLCFEKMNTFIDQYGIVRYYNQSRVDWLFGAHLGACAKTGVVKKHMEQCYIELQQARFKLEQAKQRLGVCQHNVTVMVRSFEESKQARSYADSASNHASEAEKIMTEIEDHMIQKVQNVMQKKQQCIEEISENILKSDCKIDSSNEKKQKAYFLIEEYADLVAMARVKLEDRTDLLEQFDLPENIV